SAAGPTPPEHLQVIERLPRRASGEGRGGILQLVAMNPVDQIDGLIAADNERSRVAPNLAERHHLRDPFAFYLARPPRNRTAPPCALCSCRCLRAGREPASGTWEGEGAGLEWLCIPDCLGLPSDTGRRGRAAPQPPASPGNELLAVVVVAVAEIEHVEQVVDR